MKRTRGQTGLGRGALLAIVVLAIASCGSRAGPTTLTTAGPVVPSPASSLGLDADSGLPLVALVALPPEAAETMARIATDGPFPYRQDGATFENREGILPDADDGYYHEFTVETPGSADRGARRIVIGNQGEAYWTDDHYGSFWRIAP